MDPRAICPLTSGGSGYRPAVAPLSTSPRSQRGTTALHQLSSSLLSSTSVLAERDCNQSCIGKPVKGRGETSRLDPADVRAACTYYLWEQLYSFSPVSFTMDRLAYAAAEAAGISEEEVPSSMVSAPAPVASPKRQATAITTTVTATAITTTTASAAAATVEQCDGYARSESGCDCKLHSIATGGEKKSMTATEAARTAVTPARAGIKRSRAHSLPPSPPPPSQNVPAVVARDATSAVKHRIEEDEREVFSLTACEASSSSPSSSLPSIAPPAVVIATNIPAQIEKVEVGVDGEEHMHRSGKEKCEKSYASESNEHSESEETVVAAAAMATAQETDASAGEQSKSASRCSAGHCSHNSSSSSSSTLSSSLQRSLPSPVRIIAVEKVSLVSSRRALNAEEAEESGGGPRETSFPITFEEDDATETEEHHHQPQKLVSPHAQYPQEQEKKRELDADPSRHVATSNGTSRAGDMNAHETVFTTEEEAEGVVLSAMEEHKRVEDEEEEEGTQLEVGTTPVGEGSVSSMPRAAVSPPPPTGVGTDDAPAMAWAARTRRKVEEQVELTVVVERCGVLHDDADDRFATSEEEAEAGEEGASEEEEARLCHDQYNDKAWAGGLGARNHHHHHRHCRRYGSDIIAIAAGEAVCSPMIDDEGTFTFTEGEPQQQQRLDDYYNDDEGDKQYRAGNLYKDESSIPPSVVYHHNVVQTTTPPARDTGNIIMKAEQSRDDEENDTTVMDLMKSAVRKHSMPLFSITPRRSGSRNDRALSIAYSASPCQRVRSRRHEAFPESRGVHAEHKGEEEEEEEEEQKQRQRRNLSCSPLKPAPEAPQDRQGGSMDRVDPNADTEGLVFSPKPYRRGVSLFTHEEEEEEENGELQDTVQQREHKEEEEEEGREYINGLVYTPSPPPRQESPYDTTIIPSTNPPPPLPAAAAAAGKDEETGVAPQGNAQVMSEEEAGEEQPRRQREETTTDRDPEATRRSRARDEDEEEKEKACVHEEEEAPAVSLAHTLTATEAILAAASAVVEGAKSCEWVADADARLLAHQQQQQQDWHEQEGGPRSIPRGANGRAVTAAAAAASALLPRHVICEFDLPHLFPQPPLSQSFSHLPSAMGEEPPRAHPHQHREGGGAHPSPPQPQPQRTPTVSPTPETPVQPLQQQLRLDVLSRGRLNCSISPVPCSTSASVSRTAAAASFFSAAASATAAAAAERKRRREGRMKSLHGSMASTSTAVAAAAASAGHSEFPLPRTLSTEPAPVLNAAASAGAAALLHKRRQLKRENFPRRPPPQQQQHPSNNKKKSVMASVKGALKGKGRKQN